MFGEVHRTLFWHMPFISVECSSLETLTTSSFYTCRLAAELQVPRGLDLWAALAVDVHDAARISCGSQNGARRGLELDAHRVMVAGQRSKDGQLSSEPMQTPSKGAPPPVHV